MDSDRLVALAGLCVGVVICLAALAAWRI